MKTPSRFPVKVKSGDVVVKIYNTSTAQYSSYVVAYYEGDQRKRLKFADFGEAHAKALSIAKEKADGQHGAVTLTNQDRDIYQRALSHLNGLGISLDVATKHFSESVKILGSDLVIEASRHYAKRNLQKAVPMLVKEVVEELINSKKAQAERAAKAGKGPKGASPRYIEDLNGRLKKFYSQINSNISSVTGEDIRGFLDKLSLSPRSYNNYRSILNTFFEFAKARKYLPSDWNELESVDEHEDSSGDIKIFTPDELKKLLDKAEGECRAYIAIAGFAGLRSAEIQRLDWSEIDLARGFIKVAQEKSKTGSRRLVPISANLRQWLSPYANLTGRVWPHSKPYLHEKMREISGEVKVTWKQNALRHSYVSYRVAEIQNVPQVALEAGNSPKMIFENYRELVTPEEAVQWFAVIPETPENVVDMGKKAA